MMKMDRTGDFVPEIFRGFQGLARPGKLAFHGWTWGKYGVSSRNMNEANEQQADRNDGVDSV